MKYLNLRRIAILFLTLAMVAAGLPSCGEKPDDGNETTDAPTDAPTEAPLTEPRVTENPDIPGADFLIELPEGHEPRILQVTDTQTIVLSGVRKTKNNTRYDQVSGAFFNDSEESHDEDIRAWRYVEEAVNKQNPDFIVMTGDNIYGQTDDSGEQWLRMIEKMDAFGIPWAVIFGNHDNESAKGVKWQIEQVQNSKYGIIKQGSVTGNCNYTIAVKQGNQYKAFLVMLDSNGCSTRDNPGEGMESNNVDYKLIHQDEEICADQIDWVKQSYTSFTQAVGEQVDAYWYFHIPPKEVRTACVKRYGKRFPLTAKNSGDFGKSIFDFVGFKTEGFWSTALETNCRGMFVGHEHTTSLSIMTDDGIRVTFGLKTGTYDSHDSDMLGTTLLTLTEKGGEVKHCYTELPYYDVPNEW